ncbi:hypothetical protein D3C75_845830 [compost metagenome]
MGQQVMNGDVHAELGKLRLLQNIHDFAVQCKLALLYQLADGYRCEQLGAGGIAETGVGAVGFLFCFVGAAVCAGGCNSGIAVDEHCSRKARCLSLRLNGVPKSFLQHEMVLLIYHSL